jgi:hypothetical protein
MPGVAVLKKYPGDRGRSTGVVKILIVGDKTRFAALGHAVLSMRHGFFVRSNVPDMGLGRESSKFDIRKASVMVSA